MIDSYGRTIDYLRVSITDRCNLRCRYCMPDGITWLPMEEILTLEEIVKVCQQAAQIGIHNIKITGGEPLVRKGCTDLIRMIKKIPGNEQVTLTTNGLLLAQYANELYEAGLDAVNVSLDTLIREKYTQITGFDALPQVLEGIQAMEQFPVRLKINAVLQKGINDHDWQSLLELSRDHTIDVRFIEMMPIGYGQYSEPVSNTALLEDIQAVYGSLMPDTDPHGNGPAIYCHIPGFQGSVGFISAIHGKFCHQCNRLRLTSTGLIKPCLCYSDTISLKNALRKGTDDDVRALLIQAIAAKPSGHSFEHITSVTEQQEMSKIGG